MIRMLEYVGLKEALKSGATQENRPSLPSVVIRMELVQNRKKSKNMHFLLL